MRRHITVRTDIGAAGHGTRGTTGRGGMIRITAGAGAGARRGAGAGAGGAATTIGITTMIIIPGTAITSRFHPAPIVRRILAAVGRAMVVTAGTPRCAMVAPVVAIAAVPAATGAVPAT